MAGRTTFRSSIAVAVGLTALVFATAAGVAGLFEESLPGVALGIIVASPLAGWIIGRLVARRITSPLEQLAGAAASFAAGNHSVRADVRGPREVRMIASAFNRMAEEVSDAIAQLTSEERRKTQFVSDVSHELRTPLTAIRGAAETLLDGDVAPDDQERFLSTIAIEAERLTRLANDLLTLQRIEGATGEIPIRRFDIRLAVDRAAAMLEPLFEHRGARLVVTGRAPSVLGDVDRIQQVVANLVDNASRMVGDGGTVEVALSAGDDGAALLTVSDDGPGIPEDDLPNLFDRFYRADTSRTRTSGGAGLGLAIVRAIVNAHGGSITARNLEPHGSCFTVTLPAAPK